MVAGDLSPGFDNKMVGDESETERCGGLFLLSKIESKETYNTNGIWKPSKFGPCGGIYSRHGLRLSDLTLPARSTCYWCNLLTTYVRGCLICVRWRTNKVYCCYCTSIGVHRTRIPDNRKVYVAPLLKPSSVDIAGFLATSPI